MKANKFMRGIGGSLLTLGLLFGLIAISGSTSQAQYRNRDGYGYGQNVYRIAADQGYRDGIERGSKDARERERFNPDDASQYKKATNGYRSEYGNKDAYKQSYREGFRRGYDVGFRQYTSGGNGGYYPNNDPYYGNNDPYGNNGGYGGNGGYGRNDVGYVAQEQGYRDGLNQGAEHGRDGKRYDPQGTRSYKNADQGYRSEYGNRDEYRRIYRDSFVRGYEEGYRSDYRGNNGGVNNNGRTRDTVISILGAILGGGF